MVGTVFRLCAVLRGPELPIVRFEARLVEILDRSPGDLSGEILIAVGISRKDLEESFESVTPAGLVWSRYARPYDNDLTIYVVRGLKVPFEQVWRALRSYI